MDIEGVVEIKNAILSSIVYGRYLSQPFTENTKYQ